MQAALATAAVAALALTGCAATSAPEPAASAPEVTSTSVPAPTASESDATAAAEPPRTESLAEVAGTRWSGRDSEGDSVTFEFEQGGQLTFFSFGEERSFENDRWTIAGETLTWLATFGFPYGTCTYTGALDTEAQVIDATYTCDRPGAPSGSIELERRAD